MKIKKEWVENSKINKDDYLDMYNDSIKNNNQFWSKQADRVEWEKKFTKVKLKG